MLLHFVHQQARRTITGGNGERAYWSGGVMEELMEWWSAGNGKIGGIPIVPANGAATVGIACCVTESKQTSKQRRPCRQICQQGRGGDVADLAPNPPREVTRFGIGFDFHFYALLFVVVFCFRQS